MSRNSLVMPAGRAARPPVFPRNNNLEWLRLIFATQVVINHTSADMGFAIPSFIYSFPGVPAFFLVSGFLIYSSYINSPGVRYFQNRFLRLYPGLIFVTFGGATVTLIAHGWKSLLSHALTYVAWFFGQLTLGQGYNPGLFRDVGVGVVNGSLWSLTVEMLFYLSVPLIVLLERRFRFTIPVLFLLSFLLYAIGPSLWTTAIFREKTVFNFLELTPLVWGWMFASGILAAKYFIHLKRWIKYAPVLVLPMIGMILWGPEPLFLINTAGNRLGIIYFLCYISMVLWLGFVVPHVHLSFDLSYGTYIWHMPVINLLLVLGIHSAPLVFALTISIATASWFLVERPTLRLKRKSLHPVE
jgi:peptidoglycan/LPS O-acetylase OafA/YrhL